ncbi:CDP-glycerol glycerophosphotransferase family protein [Lactiplantibacillus paraplantarum]|uniref:CDP-glycerol glycerophosphotransferase n=1 Tax=Lactiplantibacillus paraplantarum TaxID=60520 RepID=A0A2I9CVH1_9LACO|nr:CDP-glycerol glycerophosphotransferase family protein [Lactiplantibacillus paraplantarum]AVW09245.1 CDP-glycerol glycerophosphotransferase family protein [Lactiplantibacillus paraplantarum]AYJ37511.1 CDP-glycerol glycerophosphotransferase family protein [Lactiplantibacillus paraplantarum]ERL45289.1 teichoic acid biosynthesis protein [Lactiplantibacillus paraplantarum]KRL51231.1 tagF1 protein [Lactiplantibacillus paraplantarum DSM 10667]MCU4682468.1 CDP-glycerol glycerophosphotransferase fam
MALKDIISQVYRRLFNVIATVCPVRKHVVLFEAFNGKVPMDNPLYVYEALQIAHPDWKLVWGVKRQLVAEAQEKYPKLKIIPRFSAKWLLVAPVAEFWVLNARMPYWLKKNSRTTYIQTWHGTPLKRLGIDIPNVSMPGTDTNQYRQNFTTESKRWDFLIAPNQFSKEVFRKAFDFKNQFLDYGYPRNDRLVHQRKNRDVIAAIKKRIVGNKTGKVILYAPTWRDDFFIRKGMYKMNLPFSLAAVVKSLSKEDVLIIRPHYLVAESINIQGFEDNVKLCVDEDINDLYLISDLLITDYSSVMFDYAILNRPMLFYPYDLAHYQGDVRGFYFDYNKVPGPIVTNEQDFLAKLDQFLTNGGYPNEIAKMMAFRTQFTEWEQGTASQRVVKLITNISGKKFD